MQDVRHLIPVLREAKAVQQLTAPAREGEPPVDRNRLVNDLLTFAIGVMMVALAAIAYVVKGDIPPGLLTLVGIVVGYYFGRAQASSRPGGPNE